MNNLFIKQSSDIYGPEWVSFALPKENTSSNYLGKKKAYDGCTMFEIEKDDNSLDVDICTGDFFEKRIKNNSSK